MATFTTYNIWDDTYTTQVYNVPPQGAQHTHAITVPRVAVPHPQSFTQVYSAATYWQGAAAAAVAATTGVSDLMTGGWGSGPWGGGPAPLPPAQEDPKLSIAELQRKLADMLGQVEAEEKARPVLQAIDAMHGYRKSDGRPFAHYDPLLKE